MHSNRNASSVSILAFLYIEITSASQIMFESHIREKTILEALMETLILLSALFPLFYDKVNNETS